MLQSVYNSIVGVLFNIFIEDANYLPTLLCEILVAGFIAGLANCVIPAVGLYYHRVFSQGKIYEVTSNFLFKLVFNTQFYKNGFDQLFNTSSGFILKFTGYIPRWVVIFKPVNNAATYRAKPLFESFVNFKRFIAGYTKAGNKNLFGAAVTGTIAGGFGAVGHYFKRFIATGTSQGNTRCSSASSRTIIAGAGRTCLNVKGFPATLTSSIFTRITASVRAILTIMGQILITETFATSQANGIKHGHNRPSFKPLYIEFGTSATVMAPAARFAKEVLPDRVRAAVTQAFGGL